MGSVVGNIKVNPTGVMEDDKLNKIMVILVSIIMPQLYLFLPSQTYIHYAYSYVRYIHIFRIKQ